MAMSWGMPSALEPGGNGLAVERVWHVFGAQPALAGYADAIGEVVEATGAVGIGVDGDLHAVVAGFFDVAPVNVETGRVCVDLDGNPTAGSRFDDLVDIDVVPFAVEQQAAGQVPDDCRARVFDGADYAGGHFGTVEVELRVHRDDDILELFKYIVGVDQ